MNWRKVAYQTVRNCIGKPVRKDRIESYYERICSSCPRDLAHQLQQEMEQYSLAIPFYKNRSSKAYILTKEQVRSNFDALKGPHQSPYVYQNGSGGSTGVPVKFLQDEEYSDWGEATERYFYRNFLGIDPLRETKVFLWGSPRDMLGQSNWRARLTNWTNHTVLLNAFNMSHERMREYIGVLNRVRPAVVKAYAISLLELARFSREHNLPIRPPRVVYSSADVLTDTMRAIIEETFQAKVYDFYGSREVGPIAGECRNGKKHLFIFNNWIEVADPRSDSLVTPGKTGRLLVSNLHNRAMPFLRFDIGDMGAISEEPCACGSTLPVLTNFEGRLTDHFVRRNGDLVHGAALVPLFQQQEWIKQFQFCQMDYNKFQLRLIRSGEIPPSWLTQLQDQAKYVFGNDTTIEISDVDAIPRTPQGKAVFFKNMIPLQVAHTHTAQL